MIIAPGASSISVDVFFADDTGAAVTGKVASDFPVCRWSSGSNTADTTITLSDLAAITTAHPNDNTAGGVKEREGGVYRLDLPNNVFTATGRKTITFAETTNKRILAPPLDVQYVQGDVRQLLGTAWLTPGTAGTPDVNTKTLTAGAITAASIAADAITAAKIADGAIDAATFAAGAIDATAIATDAIGSNEIAAGAVTKIQTGLATPTNITAATGVVLSSAGVQAIWDALTSALTAAGSIGKRLVDFVTTLVYAAPPAAAPTAAQVRAEMDSNSTQLAKLGTPAVSVSADIADVNAKTINLPSDPADASDITAAFAAVLTTAMAESYPADGATMSMAQFAYLLRSFLTDFSVSGLTVTARKIDGSTTSSTYSLNSADNPTSITRVS